MQSLIFKIYSCLPIFFQNLFISIYGIYWRSRRFGGIFKNEINSFVSRNNFTKEEWDNYQESELRKLLVHAFTNVPFYQKKYTKAGFNLKSFKNFKLKDLKKLPFLEKDELRRFGRTDLLAKNRNNGSFYTSSGSTGTPVHIFYSNKFHQRWSAVFETRIRNWANVDRFDSRAMIGSRLVVPLKQKKPPYYRYNWYENQLYYSINHLSKHTASSYIESMKKTGVDYLTGYANSVWLLAKYAIELNLDPLKLKAVITSSEKLTKLMRADISEFFQCKVYDSYSGIESCGLISECERGLLHWSPDASIMETQKMDTVETNLSELICTSLLNYDQPLIRYRIGDLVSLDLEKKCKCKREMPIIKELVGRTDDIVTLKDGRQLGSFNRFFADIKGISKAQVIQNTYSNFHINIIRSDDYDESTLNKIQYEFSKRIGDVDLTFNLVEKIPLNENGKFRAVISKIK